MKKQLQLIFSLLVMALAINAQVEFSDDFEGYSEGDLIGASSTTWRTWGGQGGGVDDVPIVSDRANSGSNSLRLTAVGQGGPGDIVLPFGGRYASGNFHLDFMINVPQGASAYYNFQGETNPGAQWVYNVFFTSDGLINFAEGGNTSMMAATFVPDEWTKMDIDVDLDNNVWAFSVNGECVGSFQNTDNNLASLNLFPTAGDDYYIDDVNMSYSPDLVDITTDAMLTLDANVAIGVVGGGNPISGKVTNIGSTLIDGFDLTFASSTETFSDMIEPGESVDFVMEASSDISLGVNAEAVILSNVDGDEISCNNISTIVGVSIDVPRGKKYVAEEATGTWCQFCPRGDVFMNYMNDTYKDLFIGVAVHAGDPMDVMEYSMGQSNLPFFAGYPSILTERSASIDPLSLEADFVAKIQEPSPAEITIAALFDESTKELKINANVEALSTIFPSAGLILLLTEDGVTGTDAGYNQVNAYAGGTNGTMGGYELLPDPVPAAQMVYNHVARALINGFDGEDFGEGMTAGDTKTLAYSFTLPDEWDAEQIHIVAIYRDADGTTPTGNKATILEAEMNDLSSTIDPILAANTDVYPNPFSESTNVVLDLQEAANVSIEITDAVGRLVISRDYGMQSGKSIIPVDANQLSGGIYFINILAGNSFTSKRVVVSK